MKKHIRMYSGNPDWFTCSKFLWKCILIIKLVIVIDYIFKKYLLLLLLYIIAY